MLIIITMTGCSTGKETDSPSDSESVSQIPQFAIATKIQSDNPQSLIYTGNELRIPYMLRDQSEADAQWGLEIMLDGVLQDFTIDDGTDHFAEEKKLHIISMRQGESKKVTLIFTPNIGQKGQKLNLNICTLLNPEYMPADPSQYEFRPNHNLNGGLGASLTMQKAAPQQIKSSTGGIRVSALTEEQKRPYINENVQEANGNPIISNELEQRLILQLYQNTSDEKSTTAPIDGQVNLTVCCFGKPGTYRISLYVNHKLLPVFNGESYLDVTVKKDQAYQQTVSIETNGLPDKNHIYAVAAPIRDSDSSGMWYLEKTPTKLLIK